jgi:hypothetical protein
VRIGLEQKWQAGTVSLTTVVPLASYRYVASEVEENHELFVRDGHVRVTKSLCVENAIVSAAWNDTQQTRQRNREYHPSNVIR